MKPAKVLLINPGNDILSASVEPLSLEYLASYLISRGVTVSIVDEILERDVFATIKEFAPDIVGITATTPVINRAYRISETCMALGIRTVIGGIHASIYPVDVQKHCDIVVTGDGELAMADIVMNDVRHGIIDGKFVQNLDVMPLPARHLVDLDYYLELAGNRWFFGNNERTAIMITSRGCPYKCIFCHNSIKRSPVRFASASRVIEEIKWFIDTHRVRSFFFIDDDFLSHRKRFQEITNAIEREQMGIRWSCNARTSDITGDVLERARSAGCQYISFGFESGSQRILDVLEKAATVEQNTYAIRLCHEHGIKVMGSIMVGNPTETARDLILTEKFIIENPIDFVGLCITTPFPGTKLWEYAAENCLLPERMNWNDFSVSSPSLGWVPNTAMSYKEVLYWYDRIDRLIEAKKQKLSLAWVFKLALKSPVETMKQAYKSKHRLLKYLKRIKW